MKIQQCIYLICICINLLDVTVTQFPTDKSKYLIEGRKNVRRVSYTTRTKTRTWCLSLFKWFRCTEYKSKRMYKLQCLKGWQNYYGDLSACTFPICNGQISYDSRACTNTYTGDSITYRNGETVKKSGGVCVQPGKCDDCNDGFYVDRAECRICPKIANCYHRRCSKPSDNTCIYCHGEVKPKPYWRAYTPAIDEGKTCQKACSWRSDSTRCFPGNCTSELASQCTCVPGFTGTHCEIIAEKPTIIFNQMKLKASVDGGVENPADPNSDYIEPMPTIWTKEVGLHTLDVRLDGYYTIQQQPQQGPDRTGEKHYVTDWKYGVTGGEIHLQLYREGTLESTTTSSLPEVPNEYCTNTSCIFKCPGSAENPKPTNYKCSHTFYLNYWGDGAFKHDDILDIEMSLHNGGFVKVIDKEENNKPDDYPLIGQTETRKFKYHFDTEPPYQKCVKNGGISCSQPLTAPDITAENVINFSWNDWTDGLSQLKRFTYKVCNMASLGNDKKLQETYEQIVIKERELSVGDSSAQFTLPSPGMYSLLFVAWDNAGNHRTARKLILFDDKSKVETQTGTVLRVVTASKKTDYVWVVKDTNTVEVQFINRYINGRHTTNNWLKSVGGGEDVEPPYDDNYGRRTTSAVDNVNSIVDFKVSFVVMSSATTIRESRPLTSIANIHDQSDTLALTWKDGDRLDVMVRATDVLSAYCEENITVYRDASPAVVENLYLTRGSRNDIFVHNTEDFTKMTIEWDAYDYHSGIDTVYWKLYDNYTNTVIEHGHENLIAQGNTKNISECQAVYGSEPGQCYCTPFWGCFHKHFTVKPDIKQGAGLHVGKDKGVHDYDYYIEINVTNIAKLTTVQTKKITIDVSPPHTGVVHDGLNGTMEVDYQQVKTLHAYWDGFFDRESGVKFYLYTFNTSCQDSRTMIPDTGNANIVETTSCYATYTVTSEEKYFVTVVAYNRALEPSTPVCSDGVTVDTTISSVKEMIVENARIRGGLVTDANKTNIWILGSDRVRRLVDNVTDVCRNKATVVDDINLYPLMRDNKGEIVNVDGPAFCRDNQGSPTAIKTSIMKSSMMTLTWLPVESLAGILDYDVGLSSTVSGGAAPDIMGYISTNQHSHFTLKHADLPDGTEFYFQIKTISKSEVEGIQTIGPCVMDTTPPDHSGQIVVTKSGEYIMATWSSGDFIESEDFYDLVFHFAIGHEVYGTSIQNYQPLQEGGGCVMTIPPTCTAVMIKDLDWQLHGHHTYFVTIKAENTAGLYTLATSLPYIHYVQLASKGVVLDIRVDALVTGNTLPYRDIEDIDFQENTSQLAARWSGFVHPHLDVTFNVAVGTTVGGTDILDITNVGNATLYRASNLVLTYFKTYYFTVEAVTSVGSVNVTSDGVTVVQHSAKLTGVQVFDGVPCNQTGDALDFEHHDKDNRVQCVPDVDYQASRNSLQAYWIIPDDMTHYTPDVYWAVEVKESIGHKWNSMSEYRYISSVALIEGHDVVLLPGQTYRSVIKICARETCFTPLYTNGVTILSSPPLTGSLFVTHINGTVTGNNEMLDVHMSRFYDPDVSDMAERYDVIDTYEWTITDNSNSGQIYTKWSVLNNSKIGVNQEKMDFRIELNGTMDFSKCKRLAVRGYNKARLSSVVTADIKSCTAFNPKLIVPNIVIDAIGDPDFNTDGPIRDGYGKPVFLAKNKNWNEEDVDYTPYMNYISAVWPTLRHEQYEYAVLEVDVVDATTYYLPASQFTLPDPCFHPYTVSGSCGITNQEFVNIKFPPGPLLHGKKYIVCIHAQQTTKQHETWTEHLPEISTCSNGVVIDLTPPSAGKVWIGHLPNIFYQTTKSHIYVNWESFIDVEEYNTNSHASGIKSYVAGIGTSTGGTDIVAFTDVGVTNHAAFHDLSLQDGHKYYATITATDFAGRSTTVTSDPVIVDTSPPVKTNNPITISGRHITSKSEVSACWKGVFMDPESGIQYFTWSVGSKPGYSDVMIHTKVPEVECAVSDVNKPLHLHEGHAYYITVRAYNGAKLFSEASSWAFVVDFSPPVKGHVYDGKQDNSKASLKDVDFQTDTSYIAAFWEGFYDPHSPIKEYNIRVGTCKNCSNILQDQPIGITEDFVLPVNHFGVGMTYYTTVTACTTADLCSSVTSDGVILDNSPPSPGVVKDGTGDIDTHYQYERTYVGAKWFGFTDPQSGLASYEWWVGTTVGGHDVMSPTRLHLEEVAINTNITLPIGRKIYITVRAYNKAGLYSQTTSNGFIIDTTPPVVTGPFLSHDIGSVMPDSIVLRDTFRITWAAEDQESNIQRQYLSMKAHRGGEFHLASTKVSGIVRDFTFTGLELHDGVKYYVTVITCNGAGLCSQSESSAILVDTSPPTRGMFAVKTDHVSNVVRHVPPYMTWTSQAVYLSWLGFSDLHTGIDYYMISVGSEYMLNDLNQNTEPARISHSTLGHLYDEGYVQTAKIDTSDLHKLEGGIFITLWAVNKVGLKSPIIHALFNLIPGGSLELVRRCTAFSCKGHCVCAPQDQLCPSSTSCIDKSADPQQTQLTLDDVLEFRSFSLTTDKNITPSAMCLAASWKVSLFGQHPPIWYEWSVGYTSSSTPEGVFHPSEDRVWHDAGQNSFVIFTLPRGAVFHDSVKYSFFIRVWFSSEMFLIFKSNGITISNSINGGTGLRKVKEYNLDAIYMNDMDYIKPYPFAVDWKHSFDNAEENIDRFELYLSTYPGGQSVLSRKLPKWTTNYKLIRYDLEPRVKIYSNVIAYSKTGTHNTVSSDGFQIDDEKPIAGVVYNGIGGHDIKFQSYKNTVSASWHGYVDRHSGITAYFWCVGLTLRLSECDVIPWTNVGLSTLVIKNLTSYMEHGSMFYHKVYAVDRVGHASSTFISNGVRVDTTPPVSQQMTHIESTNLVKNPSFELTRGKELNWSDFLTTDVCSLDLNFEPKYWDRIEKACIAVISSNVNLAKHGRKTAIVRGSMKQNIEDLVPGGFYRITFVTSHIPGEQSIIANKEGFIEFGGTRYVFLLYTKGHRHDGHGNGEKEIISWHSHTYYFHAQSATVTLTVGSMDKNTGMFLDDVMIHEVKLNVSGTENTQSHVVFLHEWGSIHGSWSFLEDESNVIDYQWAIGYTRGGSQIQEFTSVGLRKFAYNSNVTLVHNSKVYVTVIATNSAGLQGVSYSPPLLVDLTGPVITEVNDGTDLDLDSWEQDDILVNFKTDDPESGIKFCEWAIGTQPFGNDIQAFVRILPDVRSGSIYGIGHDKAEGKHFYSTVKCENNGGLQSVMSSDGVKISRKAPNITNVILQTIPLSSTEYRSCSNFQSVPEKLRLKWTGFEDFIGMEGYTFSIQGAGKPYSWRKILSYDQVYSYVQLDKLSMTEGRQEITLKAINLQLKSSPEVHHNITLSRKQPQLHASKDLQVVLDKTKNVLVVSWEDLFTSDYSLYYEVSAGTEFWGGNIIQWMETRHTSISFDIPKFIKDYVRPVVYVTVRAISASGMYINKSGSVTLPTNA